MIQTKHVINSLPLVADVLGRKYGVQVRIGGDKACTNGKIIYLPSLPLDSDSTALNLARAYLDHESAHLRETDFQIFSTGGLSPVEKYITNILEDYRVEHKLAGVFPGCEQNLNWLIRHLFLNEKADNTPQEEAAQQLFYWLLLYVRAWDVPEISKEQNILAHNLDQHFPGLRFELEAVLNTVPVRCTDTRACMEVARELVSIIKNYITQPPQPQEEQETGGDRSGKNQSEENKEADASAGQGSQTGKGKLKLYRRQLQKLLENPKAKLPKDIGSSLSEALQGLHQESSEHLTIATPAPRPAYSLNSSNIADSRKATTALRTKLQALMQSKVLVRNHISRTGRIDSKHLSRVAIAEPRIFVRHGDRQGINTAVHILLDASSSMCGSSMALACKACFAVASALDVIKGVGLAVTAFPGETIPTSDGGRRSCETVSPILKHREQLHNRFNVAASNSTPMASALWWVMQQMYSLPEQRKIILMITDGEPDSMPEATHAVQAALKQGFEVYGIGIVTLSIAKLLPNKRSQIITSLPELAPAMFAILQDVLVHPARPQGRAA